MTDYRMRTFHGAEWAATSRRPDPEADPQREEPPMPKTLQAKYAAIERALEHHRRHGRVRSYEETADAKLPWTIDGDRYSTAQVEAICRVLAKLDTRGPAPCVLDSDDDQLTFAVTLHWRRPWALDTCEAGAVAGDLYRLLVGHYGDPEWDQLAGVDAVTAWDPDEEVHVGKNMPAVRFERQS